MNDILQLNSFHNGLPGALTRMTRGFADAGIGFIPLGVHAENVPLSGTGPVPDTDGYRSILDAPREWVESCLILPEVDLAGLYKCPFIKPWQKTVIGDAINIVPDELEKQPAELTAPTELDTAFLIGGRGGSVFGHWLLDFVPQALTALTVSERLGRHIPIVVANCPPFGKEMLRMLGIDGRCLFPNPGDTLHVRRLYQPLITKLGPRYSVEVLQKSFTRLLTDSGINVITERTDSTRLKLLIGRTRQPHCSNFEALQTALKSHGFTVLYPEKHPLSEQIKLFRQAEIIVGEDGSALHNAGFCLPDAKLIVYSRGNKINYWHGAVAGAARLSWAYLQSKVAADGQSYSAPIKEILARL